MFALLIGVKFGTTLVFCWMSIELFEVYFIRGCLGRNRGMIGCENGDTTWMFSLHRLATFLILFWSFRFLSDQGIKCLLSLFHLGSEVGGM